MDYLECPICEEQFTDRSAEQVITCPSCQRKFLASSAGRITLGIKPPSGSVPRPVVVEQMVHEQIKQEKKEQEKELKIQDVASESNEPNQERSGTSAITHKTADVRAKSKRRRKNRLLITIGASLAFAAISGILGGVLILQMTKSGSNPITSTDDQRVASTQTDEQGNTTTQPPEFDSPNSASVKTGNASPRVAQTPTRFEDLPPQKTRFLKKQDLDECWDLVRPYLVTLKVHNVRGVHEAVGTIIDSRGWIVTSHPAIKGATKIEVIASPELIDDLNDDHLTDEVRGIVTSASDPDSGIAVLAINSRFVISYAELKMETFSQVVAGSYYVQSAPPSNLNLYGRTEVRIQSRSQSPLSPPSDSDDFIRRPVNLESSELSWLDVKSDTRPLPGTPLVSADGELAAINVIPDDKTSQYVLLDRLKERVANSDGTVDPLSTLGGLGVEQGTVQINQFHPFLAKLQQLNQLGDQCKAFDWIPTTGENYSVFQEFGSLIYDATRYVKDNPDDDEDLTRPVEERLKQWQNTMFGRFSRPNSDDLEKIKLMNEIAEKQLRTKNQCVPFIGAALPPDLVSNRLFFELHGTDTLVGVDVDPKSDPKRPSIMFLMFVMTPEQPKRFIRKSPQLGSFTAQIAELFFDVGPLD